MNTATIKSDQLLPHPPARVWRAFSEPALFSRWFLPNTYQPIVGHQFTLDTGGYGVTQCEVLAIEPGSLLRISWKNGALDTTVTWRLVPEGTGTRVYLEHAGFDLDHPIGRMAYDGMTPGWSGRIGRSLATCVDELTD